MPSPGDLPPGSSNHPRSPDRDPSLKAEAVSTSAKVTGQIGRRLGIRSQACWLLNAAELFPTSHWAPHNLSSPSRRGGRAGRWRSWPLRPLIPMEIGLGEEPLSGGPRGAKLGMGWHPTESSMLEEPLQGAAGAVGDRAPQGPGAGAKIGWHHQLARLPPSCPAGGLAPQHRGLLLGNLQRVPRWWGEPWNLGWGGMTSTWLSSW